MRKSPSTRGVESIVLPWFGTPSREARLLDGYTYRVSVDWMRVILRQGAERTNRKCLKLAVLPQAWSASLALLCHGAMDSSSPPRGAPSLAGRLGSMFSDPTLRSFLADACALTDGEVCSLRRVRVHIETGNALTDRFRPPEPADVGPALEKALRFTETAIDRHAGNPIKQTICALLGAQILLTIHPFEDGNGRTARMYFAAKVMRHAGAAWSALVGMLLMYRAGAHEYHQASWALRSGNAEPMVDLFVACERLACERFAYMEEPLQPTSASVERCWCDLRAMR